MIRLFQHRGDPVRGELDELVKVLSCLKSSNAQTRCAVGAGVHLANTEFIRRFAGMDSFRRIPVPRQYSVVPDSVDLPEPQIKTFILSDRRLPTILVE